MVDKYEMGELVQLKKKHPCGSDRWLIKRTGVDFMIECQGCQHRANIPRVKFKKTVKKKV